MTIPVVRAREAMQDHIDAQQREIEAKEGIISLQADELASLKARVALLEAGPFNHAVRSFPGVKSFPVIT